jgi:hypothetical protein
MNGFISETFIGSAVLESFDQSISHANWIEFCLILHFTSIRPEASLHQGRLGHGQNQSPKSSRGEAHREQRLTFTSGETNHPLFCMSQKNNICPIPAGPRLGTLNHIVEHVLPRYLSNPVCKATARQWLRRWNVPALKTNPSAKRGGGAVLYPLSRVEARLREMSSR